MRALAKARAEVSPNLRPVDEEVMSIHRSNVSHLFNPVTPTLSLSLRTLEANRIVSWNKRDNRTGAFDILRTKALKVMMERGWSTLAITSPTQACGKTTVAINLAFSIAHQMASEMVLVDLDLRQPQIAACLGIDSAGDLGAFFEGRTPLSSYFVAAGGAQLRVVPNKTICAKATELLATPQADEFFGDLRKDRSGRIGIFDLPPLLVGDDAIAVLPRVDCARGQKT